ncbi:MAG: V-type ATP synthase subunit K [Candidatus Hydrogenedentes bacterium]|nr:V-type ATP synthase subunit K [Candidatus Hydrogenedentota bacterium]
MDSSIWVEVGRGLAYSGAALAFGLGGCGSARGIAIASQQAAGVLGEKPDLFGRLLVMVALPGTQGFYGFIAAFMLAMQTGLVGGKIAVTPGTGFALLLVGFGTGLALYVSAVYQGHASAAGIALVARREDAAGRAILFPALVETYAVVALLAAILFILWLTNAGTAESPSNVLEYIGGAKVIAETAAQG